MNIMYKGRFHSYYKIETNKIYRYMYRYIMLQVNTFVFFSFIISFILKKYNWHKHSKLSEKSYKIFPWASNFFASNIATSSERNKENGRLRCRLGRNLGAQEEWKVSLIDFAHFFNYNRYLVFPGRTMGRNMFEMQKVFF